MIFVVLVCADDCSPALQTDDDLAKKMVTFPWRFPELGMARHTASKNFDWRSSKILCNRA